MRRRNCDDSDSHAALERVGSIIKPKEHPLAMLRSTPDTILPFGDPRITYEPAHHIQDINNKGLRLIVDGDDVFTLDSYTREPTEREVYDAYINPLGLDEKLIAGQRRHEVPTFGSDRIRYERADNDQLIYVDDLSKYARAIGPALPLDEDALYSCWLLHLEEIERKTKMLEIGIQR